MSPTVRLKDFHQSTAPFRFGHHPDFEASFRSCFRRARHYLREGQFDKASIIEGQTISLSELADPRHPEVFIIPRNRHCRVVDEWGDNIGVERTILHFSSTDFYVDLDKEGLFRSFGRSVPFSRLAQINQLGYLVPPRPKGLDKSQSIAYIMPTFHHNRWMHSLLVALLTEVTLARNGFSQEKRTPLVLTDGCHDIATPAGGDSIKRVDPENLGEEENFSWVLEYYDLVKPWAERFGFNVRLAQSWVKGQGLFGQLLDAIDKICYTALDCYNLGMLRDSKTRELCLTNPLVIDVWQDIQFAPDLTRFAFANPERLFLFLLLRAYEHQEFLLNPYSRALDLFLKKLVQPLYETGIITKKQLLIQDDNWLHHELEKHYPGKVQWYIEPEELSWERFGTQKEQQEFCAQLGGKIDHTDDISEFDPCLDWLVFQDGKIVPLKQVISQEKVELLEEIAASTKGYYVYYRP